MSDVAHIPNSEVLVQIFLVGDYFEFRSPGGRQAKREKNGMRVRERRFAADKRN